MKKVDIIIAVVVAEMTAWYFNWLFKISIVWLLPVIFPILGAVGIWLAYLLGKRFLFVFQGAKFLLMGGLAALIDLLILNILMLISGISSGVIFSVFKALSFVIAMCFKYLGDKLWAFNQKEMIGMGREFSRFFLITLGGLLINVVVASLIVNYINPLFGLSVETWANVAAIAAVIATVVWNFPGYKFFVFKK